MIDNELLTLLSVAENKTYTAAAKALNLTQPAISQHIRLLEQEYGIRIFVRVGNEAVPTDDGAILIKYARRIQSLYSDMERKIADNKKHAKSLVVGITHTSESNIIPEVLADYSTMRKGSHISIISDSIRNLYDKLSTYEIDLAVVEGKVPSRKFSSVLLDTDSLVAVMSNSNPLAKKKILTVEDIKKERMIVRSSTSGTSSLFYAELEAEHIAIDDFNIILEIDAVSTIKALVQKDLGISVLPKSACYEELRAHTLTVRPIENLNMIRELSLVFLKDFVDPELLDDLTSLYHQKAQTL